MARKKRQGMHHENVVLTIGFLLPVSLVLSAGLSAAGNYVSGVLPAYIILMRVYIPAQILFFRRGVYPGPGTALWPRNQARALRQIG